MFAIVSNFSLEDETTESLREHVVVYYDPYRFAGLRLRVHNLGVMLLYASGRYFLVGVRSLDSIDIFFRVCVSFLQRYAIEMVKHDDVSPLLDPILCNNDIMALLALV